MNALWLRVRWVVVRFLLLITAPAAIVFRFLGIRFLGTGLEQRLGHLLAEPYFAAQLRVEKPMKYRRLILSYAPKLVVNPAVLEALPPYFIWFRSPLMRNLFRPFQRHPFCRVDMEGGVRTATGEALQFKLLSQGQRPPNFLSLRFSHPTSARGVLAQFGIPGRDWYVVIHARAQSTFGSSDALHDYRNSPLESFESTISMILDAGGGVIRIGDLSMPPLSAREGIFDLARSSNRLPQDDLIVCRYARAFVGSTSGAFLLAALQDTPVVAVNAAPMGASKVWDESALCVPKIYRDARTGELLHFSAIFDSDIADVRWTQGFRERNIDWVDSTCEEVQGAVEEVLGWGTYSQPLPEDDELQMRMQKYFRAGNYARFSTSKFARVFLRKHSNLILDSA